VHISALIGGILSGFEGWLEGKNEMCLLQILAEIELGMECAGMEIGLVTLKLRLWVGCKVANEFLSLKLWLFLLLELPVGR